MKEYLFRHNMSAKSSPVIFYNTPVELMTTLYKNRSGGEPWPKPISGDVMLGIKKGKIPLDRKPFVDPMEE
jgi:hypothetical protein